MNKSEPILRPCLYKIAHNARSSRRASWTSRQLRLRPAAVALAPRGAVEVQHNVHIVGLVASWNLELSQ
jgi:hypothetical protein